MDNGTEHIMEHIRDVGDYDDGDGYWDDDMMKNSKSTSLSETEMQVARLCPFIAELRPSKAVTAGSPAQVASRNWWGHHQSAHKMADSTLVEVVGEGEEKFA